MGKNFDIPSFYKSDLIATVKQARIISDQNKRDLSPSIIELDKLCFKIARHFGFCYGVENAIEITYRAISENPNRRIYLLSEMIHNPHVNADLKSRGVEFLMKTSGEKLIDFDTLRPDDVVVIPAFGTTLEIFDKLNSIGIDPYLYNATCPFVEKVWKRSAGLGARNFTVIIHGKQKHEETRATFSHASKTAPSIIIRDIQEARLLARYIAREIPFDHFDRDFAGRYSQGFEPRRDLNRIGVVNQTTMLATETQIISDILHAAINKFFGESSDENNFANTRDTLCYATSENQDAVNQLIKSGGDLAIIVGGYNSSNTSHLAELCEKFLPAYYIKDSDEIIDEHTIRHLSLMSRAVITSQDWLPIAKPKINILISAGASCPDAHVDLVIKKICSLFQQENRLEKALEPYRKILLNTKK